MQRKWRFTPHDSGRIEALIRTAQLPPVVATLLVSRGIYTADDASAFLDTKLIGLRDPKELPGVPAAVDRIMAAVKSNERIQIYGDYDCDGMTATAILVNTLKLLDADVGFFVPNRLEDGYGLNETAIRRAADRDCKVIVTVDCGIGSFEHAKLCRTLGIDLIVTDHHTIGDELPQAHTVVHPRLPGAGIGFGDFCGAGVAFKLAWALFQSAAGSPKVTPEMRASLMRSLGLAAIGTVADMVPLLDENRILVEHGLRMLRADPPPGIAKLMSVAKIDNEEPLTTENISFTLAPRLNASGRLGQAQLGVELMTCPPGGRADSLAEYIHELNGSRESLQRSVSIAATKQATTEFDPESDPALVLCGVGWHQGVIGVVAGRLADKFAKPVLVLSLDASGRGMATGSGRVGGTDVDLYEALSACEHHLVRFGGHAAAAGLMVAERDIDAFRADFCEAVAAQWTDKQIVPEIRIDAEAPLTQLNLSVVEQIETLAPFGAGNPRPILCATGVTLHEPASPMGAGDRHLKVRLAQGEKKIRAVAFGAGSWVEEMNQTEGPIQIVYKPVINRWNGYQNVEIQLIDWRSTPADGNPRDATSSATSATATT